MITSEARRQANRQNALKSTGPKTPEGKARSRQNALKHGLTATVVGLPPGCDLDLDWDLKLAPDPAPAPAPAPEPAPAPAQLGPPPVVARLPGAGWQEWVGDQVGQVMAQIARAQRIEGKLRLEAAWRAGECWDNDRQLAAANLGARLGRDPSRVVVLLRQTPQGCDWLIERWRGLAQVAERAASWNEVQVELAFDLLGVPLLTRPPTLRSTTPADQAHLARTAITDLAAQRELMEQAAAVEQAIAEADGRDTPTPELARIRRYEGALHRRLHWLLAARNSADQPAATPAPNEATAAPVADETKPTPVAPDPTGTPRHRPDLAKLARRDRQIRQQARRNQRSG